MIRAIAIDDEKMALNIIINYVEKIPNIELSETFINPFKAIEYLKTHAVDIIFLDINMPDLSGLSLAEYINPQTKIIFTTAYAEHAVKSYELDAVDFLVKPFSLPRFMKAVNKAEKLIGLSETESSRKFIFIKSGYDQYKINFSEILFIESSGNYMEFVTRERKVLSRLTLKETLDLLPANGFFRVHKSFIVAIEQVESIINHKIVIADYQIPLSQSFKEDFFKKLETKGK
ncbi:MAG: LytTR family DNA-binding domain-containing protein [Bacteroidota bacterium]